MDIIIRKGKPKGRVRSEVEEKLGKEGWGTSMTEEQIDKCAFLERGVKDKYGADKSFFKRHHVDKIK